jgi:uncharacterized membrane protein
MGKGRVEAFSDGVIAVIITIMVLELKPPHEASLDALWPLVPSLLTYVVSFVFVGIYWNNHHHMLQAAPHIDGRVLWANLHLLFCENPVAQVPTALYGIVLLMGGVAWLVLQRSLVRVNGEDSMLARAVGADTKGKASAVLYATAIALSFVKTWMADVIYVVVAMMWLVPDRRIERLLHPAAGTPRS